MYTADKLDSIVLIFTGATPNTKTFPFPFIKEAIWLGIVPGYHKDNDKEIDS